jgi:hypothetical protein
MRQWKLKSLTLSRLRERMVFQTQKSGSPAGQAGEGKQLMRMLVDHFLRKKRLKVFIRSKNQLKFRTFL